MLAAPVIAPIRLPTCHIPWVDCRLMLRLDRVHRPTKLGRPKGQERLSAQSDRPLFGTLPPELYGYLILRSDCWYAVPQRTGAPSVCASSSTRDRGAFEVGCGWRTPSRRTTELPVPHRVLMSKPKDRPHPVALEVLLQVLLRKAMRKPEYHNLKQPSGT